MPPSKNEGKIPTNIRRLPTDIRQEEWGKYDGDGGDNGGGGIGGDEKGRRIRIESAASKKGHMGSGRILGPLRMPPRRRRRQRRRWRQRRRG
jgi:hypothetical protein